MKLARKQGKDIDKLFDVISPIAEGGIFRIGALEEITELDETILNRLINCILKTTAKRAEIFERVPAFLNLIK